MPEYDLFLSYDSADQKAVEALRQGLEKRGLNTFFDHTDLIPGRPWPDQLERAIAASRAAVVVVGARHELGKWQRRESWLALDRQAGEEDASAFPVVPALLPGAEPRLEFLFLNHGVRLEHGEDAIDQLVQALREPVERSGEDLPEICPYRGLDPFGPDDAPFFFGREAFTETLLERALEREFVVVAGPSGSGKSSVVSAGLWPALGRHREARAWEVVCLRPGRQPFQELGGALLPLYDSEFAAGATRRKLDREGNRLGDDLASGAIRLEQVVERVLAQSGGSTALLVIVDQFEELFRETAGDDRLPWVELLLDAVDHTPLRLLATLRSDFLDHATKLSRDLADRLGRAVEFLGALTPAELERAIRRPAERAGLSFDPGLPETMLAEIGEGGGRLPLLEFCLLELYKRRDRAERRLTAEAYGEIGRVRGALAERAEKALERVGRDRRPAARRLFTRHLVRVAGEGELGGDTRRRAPLTELDPEEREVAERLTDGESRLLVAREKSVEIVHEALIESWDRLGEWLAADREEIRVAQAASEADRLEGLRAEVPLDDLFLDDPAPFLDAARRGLLALANETPPYERLAATLWRLDCLALRRDSTAAELAARLRGALVAAIERRTGNRPPALESVPLEATPRPLACGQHPERLASFCMGADPRVDRPVTLSAYRIEVDPVTASEYALFAPERAPADGESGRLPVVNVAWAEAYVFAAWCGGRLPTEAEWEYAAAGPEGRTYPWGEEDPDCERANFAECGRRLKPVGAHPGSTTPEGIRDLAGNVWEWCGDWEDDLPKMPLIDPTGPASGRGRVLRGGAFDDDPIFLRSAYRYDGHPDFRGYRVGFRVAWSLAGGLGRP